MLHLVLGALVSNNGHNVPNLHPNESASYRHVTTHKRRLKGVSRGCTPYMVARDES